MATMHYFQTMPFSHFRQLQSLHPLHKCSHSLQQHKCRGHRFRDSRGEVHSSGTNCKQTINSIARSHDDCTHRARHLRYSQLESEWCVSSNLSINSRKLNSSYAERRKVAGTACCLQASQVDQVETKETEQVEEHSTISNSKEGNSESSDTQGWAVKKGLSALDAYFDKLNKSNEVEIPTSSAASSRTVYGDTSSSVSASEPSRGGAQVGVADNVKVRQEMSGTRESPGLSALDEYFNKLRPAEPKEVAVSQQTEKPPEEEEEEDKEEKMVKIEIISASDASSEEEEEAEYRELLQELEKALEQGAESEESNTEGGSFLSPSWGFQAGQSNSYVVNGLVAINIAVYLFGLASPKGMPGMVDASLPFLYGAKVNELIVNGEWWRMVTPMFLHSGLLHLGLSTWALLSFGPAVESAYGTLGFGMVYLIGGLFGNLMSFFHTPQGTVGGTGPIYALMASWLVYLVRNREIIGLDVADEMIRKVVIMSAINVALCNSLPIDDWNHLGAGTVGLIFGLLTCPTVQINVHVEEPMGENPTDDTMESYLLLNEGLHPTRLLLVFALSLGVFFALYSIGVPVATEFHFLHGGLGDENW